MNLKVVSLNLWHGGRLMDGILDFLGVEDADIVCLQEAYNGTDPSLEPRFRSLNVLQERFGYQGCQFAPLAIVKRPEGELMFGNAVLAKFPAAAGETLFFNEPLSECDPEVSETQESAKKLPRILQRVTLETPAGQINVFNIHGVWDLDGDNFSDRRKNMRDTILRAINGKKNIILAGDTNAQPTNKAMTDVEAYLSSVFGRELPTTFNMKRKTNPGYATARVDMLFVSPDIQVLERACHDIDISDHLPLSATLRLG